MSKPYKILRIAVIANGIAQIAGILIVCILGKFDNGELSAVGSAFMYLVLATMTVGFLLTFLLLAFPLIDRSQKGLPFYYLLAAIAEMVLLMVILFFVMSGNMC